MSDFVESANSSDNNTRIKTLLFVGVALSIGWGIRGNFGHQWGAALPGALAAMAVVIISRRQDWIDRVAYFGVFGAMGWALGACVAYMVAIDYASSGSSPSVIYGFYCLFVVGFLWGATGGAGTALPAFLSRDRLREFVVPLVSIFLVWWCAELLENRFIYSQPRFHKVDPLDWYDTDWISAALAIVVVLVRGAYRRKLDWAERLILAMSMGWWIVFLIVVALHHMHFNISMLPGKSDSWAGNVGLTIAMFIMLYRSDLKGVLLSSLVTGFLGGMAFAIGVMFKLIEIKVTHDYHTNWHSILEQSYGFMNGLAQAAAMLLLVKTAPKVSDAPKVPRFYNGFFVAVLMLLLTYLNMWKEVNDWMDGRAAIQRQLYFLSTPGWFDLFYLLLAVTVLWLIRTHLRRPIPFIPVDPLGKAQLLLLAVMWWMIVANFMKALVSFDRIRLVTEGTIFVNGLICTLMAVLWANRPKEPDISGTPNYSPTIKKALMLGAVAAVLCPIVCWGVVRAMYGDKPAGEAGLHYRFGPRAAPVLD